jgi:hypothetical protein
MLIIPVAIVWRPVRSRPIGFSLFATGSDQQAALRRGVNVALVRLTGYALCGFFLGAAGLTLSTSAGAGDPLVDTTLPLIAIATVVLCCASLAGGQGGHDWSLGGRLRTRADLVRSGPPRDLSELRPDGRPPKERKHERVIGRPGGLARGRDSCRAKPRTAVAAHSGASRNPPERRYRGRLSRTNRGYSCPVWRQS